MLHACPNLSMVGFKACEVEEVAAGALPPSLRWLILTDNRISGLPPELGSCSKLQKLMLSGNRLETLPETLRNCTGLELMRLAANRFHMLPDWLLALPKLAWLAVAGNPVMGGSPNEKPGLPLIDWAGVEILSKIGEGASGLIYKASFEGRPLAAKLFKGAMTSDGLPEHEMAASLAVGQHPHVVGALGRLNNAPAGAQGLVMPLLAEDFQPLAGPPSLETCTRDIYPEGLRLDFKTLVQVAASVAAAGEHLHSRHVFHGDLYAHNILWDRHGEALLSDFGAATCCQLEDEKLAHALRCLDVRAFGILIEELLARCDDGGTPGVCRLARQCLGANPPPFAEVAADLRLMGASL
jgi:hypothetical protein